MRGEPGLSGRASLILGIIVALAVVGGGTALVLFASSGSERDSASAGSDNPASTTSSTTSSTRSSTTTTTLDPAATTTTTAPGGGPDGAAPSGYATADPEDTPYEAIPPPAGINAALQTCSWESTNGGELQATGTITAAPDSDDVWLVTVYWLQNDRELDSQTEVYELEPSQTLPWRLTIGAPLPPLDLRCALEID
jgi:hypothetical protein